MIKRDDIDAMAIYNDSTGYWTGDADDKYSTPLDMVKYFKKHTGQEGTPQLYRTLIQEELNEWLQEANNPNGSLTNELKELADLVYVVYGYALSKGWNLNEALYRVHVNNILRVTQPDGTIKRREDGKIIKREGATKVKLEDLV